MQYVNLGRTGMRVSRICLGMMTYGSPLWREWILDEAAARPIFRRAVELGVNFFDTADMYSNGESERVTGKLVREFCRREEAVVATKVLYPVMDDPTVDSPMLPVDKVPPNRRGLSRKHIMVAIDESLQRLGLDYVDLYQIHRLDPLTPIEETMEALHDVVKAGKARYIGASSMWAWQFVQAQHLAREHGWTPFVSMQNHYNLVYREEEREMNPYCLRTGVALIPWSPLARGFLAGNRSREDQARGATTRARTDELARRFYYQESDFAIVEAVSALAAERSVTNAQIAYAWLLAKGVTAPIVGASKAAQIDDAVAATGIMLGDDEVARLEAAYRPHPVIGHR
ncbi:MAG: aldo/keto reductase [Burkholderiales bacterium]|nr:MAG: aldo/keto reductase [Burkholderiales bacterium]